VRREREEQRLFFTALTGRKREKKRGKEVEHHTNAEG